MNCVIKFSHKDFHGTLNYGNLFWLPPYLYPEHDLQKGIRYLKSKNYFVDQFPEGDGLTFNLQNLKEDLFDFELAFPWMNIRVYKEDEDLDFDNFLTSEQIIILPVSRLRMYNSIYSKQICLFPPGEFEIHKINLKNVFGGDLNYYNQDNFDEIITSEKISLRDHITSFTGIKKELFYNFPLIVFRDKIRIEDYLNLNQIEDERLIKSYSQRADKVLDIIKFISCNYTIPEMLPARAGLWNDRYSVAMVHFPSDNIAFFQSREVEVKTFIKGIGLEFSESDIINNSGILINDEDEVGEVGKLVKYALNLNASIAESDNESLKFTQIMTLIEFLGNPFEYENFKKLKGKIIAYIAKDKTDYHNLSEKFRFLSEEIRTQIIHNGKSLEDLIIDKEERKQLFKFFKNLINQIIWDFISNAYSSWDEYDVIRKERQSIFI